jgi:tetratricopeptide (TPR) repeat protein
MRLGLMAEAIPLFEQATRLSPKDPNIILSYFRIGELHLLQGHIDEAISWFERSRSANRRGRIITHSGEYFEVPGY